MLFLTDLDKRRENAMKKRHFLHGLPAVCTAMCLCLALLTGCAPAPSDSVAGPDSAVADSTTADGTLSYAEMMEAMNHPVASGLTGTMPVLQCAGMVGGCPALFGHGLAGIDAPDVYPYYYARLTEKDASCYSCMEVTLPPLPEDFPDLAPDAAAGEKAEYQQVSRLVSALADDGAGQPLLLLEDTLTRVKQDPQGQTGYETLQRVLTVCGLDQTGALSPLAQPALPERFSPDAIAENLYAAQDGVLWLTLQQFAGPDTSAASALLGFSADGALLHDLPLPAGMTCAANALTPLADGRLLVLAAESVPDGAGTRQVARFLVAEGVGSDAARWAQPLAAPPALAGAGSVKIVPQPDAAPARLLLDTGSGLVEWDLAANTAQEQAAWRTFGVNAAKIAAAFAVDSAQYLIFTSGDLGLGELRMLTPQDPAALQQREVLTLATATYTLNPGLDPIQEMVDQFNLASDRYYIQTVDWGQSSLQQDILNQALPDIVMIFNIDPSLLNKGLFLDLYRFVDADPELSRDDFLPNVLAATEVDGALPYMTAAYKLRTLVGSTPDVGATPGWTLSDCSGLPKESFFPNMTADYLQLCLAQSAGSAWLDWAAGQAHFDSESFTESLAFCAAHPEGNAAGEFLSTDVLHQPDKSLLLSYDLEGWGSAGILRSLYPQGYTLKGYPDPAGANGNLLLPNLRFAISYTCQDPEAAWQFIRGFLQPDFQDRIGVQDGYAGFPVRRDSLAAGAAAAQQRLPTYSGGYLLSQEDMTALLARSQDPLSPADTDKVIEAIGTAEHLWNVDGAFFDILYEESLACYAGQRSAAEAAAIIQNRVQTYLDEQG